MQIVTLLTDWGLSDHYVGLVKGKIYRRIPDVTVVDISHSVGRGDVSSAAYLLSECIREFPAGTIHIVGVSEIESVKTPHIVVKVADQYIVGTDNGMLGPLNVFLNEPEMQIHEIDVFQESPVFTFPVRDRFVKVAAMLAGGASLESIGPATTVKNGFIRGLFSKIVPQFDGEKRQIGLAIEGKIVFFDGYGNGCTDISRSMFEQCLRQYPFTCMIFGHGFFGRVDTLPVKDYDQVSEGNVGSVFLDNGMLEMFLSKGNLRQMLGHRSVFRITVLFGKSLKVVEKDARFQVGMSF